SRQEVTGPGSPSTCAALHSFVLHPAKLSQAGEEMFQGQSDHVVVTTLDPRDEATGAPLNRISAGLVIRFLGSEVQRNVLRREPGKMHQRGFHKLQPPRIRQTYQRDTRVHGV